jgi:BNR repeat-like domain
MQRIHRLLISLALGLLTVVAVGGASAGPYSSTTPIQASGVSPFAGCTADNVAGQPGRNFPNSEVEPWIDVNPTNPNNVVGIYQQDRWSNGGARGLVASVSTNGGASFTQVVIPKVSACSGNLAYARATDPWLSFSPNGDLYAMSLSLSADLRRSAMLVSKSSDGGVTWGDPATLIDETSDFNLNDKNSLTADPNDSDFVYAVWDRIRHPSQKELSLEGPNFNALHAFSFRSDIMFSRTTDGGKSWEPARAIFRPKENVFTVGNQIAVLPDGTLVDAFFLIRGSGVQPSTNQYREAVIVSTNKGETWSEPIIVDKHVVALVSDPDTGQAHRTGDIIPDVAVDKKTGAMYLVWQDGRFTGRAAIALSKSTDGGRTWSTPIKVNQTPLLGNLNDQAFTPSVHVAADGTAGVSYYDFRNNTAGGGTDTDHFLVHCHAACTSAASWVGNETRVTPASFDSRRAPFARGFFLGDYVGLDNIGKRFTPFFTQTTATDPANEYFATVGP